jgi:hypothetical protein
MLSRRPPRSDFATTLETCMGAARVTTQALATHLSGTLGVEFLNESVPDGPILNGRPLPRRYEDLVVRLLHLRSTTEFPVREAHDTKPIRQSLLLVNAIADCFSRSATVHTNHREQLQKALAAHELTRYNLKLP